MWWILGLAIGGCSGPSVTWDYDHHQDFKSLRTWSWAPEPLQADGGGAESSPAQEEIRGDIVQGFTR
jgi:hypothetical protein